jgi:hypothetical protein
VLRWYSLRRARALRSDPGPMTRGWHGRFKVITEEDRQNRATCETACRRRMEHEWDAHETCRRCRVHRVHVRPAHHEPLAVRGPASRARDRDRGLHRLPLVPSALPHCLSRVPFVRERVLPLQSRPANGKNILAGSQRDSSSHKTGNTSQH